MVEAEDESGLYGKTPASNNNKDEDTLDSRPGWLLRSVSTHIKVLHFRDV